MKMNFNFICEDTIFGVRHRVTGITLHRDDSGGSGQDEEERVSQLSSLILFMRQTEGGTFHKLGDQVDSQSGEAILVLIGLPPSEW